MLPRPRIVKFRKNVLLACVILVAFLLRISAVRHLDNVRNVERHSLSESLGERDEVRRRKDLQERLPARNSRRDGSSAVPAASTHLAKLYDDPFGVDHEISKFQTHHNDDELFSNNRQRQGDLFEKTQDRIIVVATIDGSFYGISRDDGNIIWKSSSSSSSLSVKDDDSTKDVLDSSVSSQYYGQGVDQSGGGGGGDDPSSKSATTSARNRKSNQSSSSNTKTIFRPLLSTTTTRGNNKTWRTAAVPSIDGRVYLTLGNGIKDTVTNNIKELVDRSPFMDARGRFFVAHKRSFAVALSKWTGEVLRTVHPEKDSKDFHLEEKYEKEDESKDVVWIGRIDYEVTVHDARTGEVDVKFSTSEILSVEDMVQGKARIGEKPVNRHSPSTVNSDTNDSLDVDDTDTPYLSFDGIHKNKIGNAMTSWRTLPGTKNEEDSLMMNMGGSWPSLNQPADLNQPEMSLPESSIISTPGGRLAMKDPDTGEVDWIADEIFDSPIVYAFESSSGTSLGVHIVPDAPMPHLFSQDYVRNEMEHQFNSEEDQRRNYGFDSERDDTVFGSHQNGELFALPLGRRSFRHSYGRNGLPHVPLLSSTIASSAKNLQAKLPPVMSHGDWQYGFENDNSYTRKITGGTKNGMDKSVARIAVPHACDQSSKYYPECLVEQYENAVGKFMSGEQLEHINSIQMSSKFSKKNGQSANGRYETFISIMTSWIPPAVALAFVVSFEMGRRERARFEEAKNQRSMKENELQTSSESLTFRRDLSDEYASSHNEQPGIISVTDEILGYGGHGTVVYKGKLDGRFVAVKRMLKAYHASADREISLLIESDGHPNVVRYFLKEIRGDFVYLALELCDMNLQDLIVSLSKQNMKQGIIGRQNPRIIFPSCGIDHALRKILFDIASGVKHIHSLRIVHRDLKPANILLAKKSNRTSKAILNSDDDDDDAVYKLFMAEMYIPKISDMGLGKQLCGPSSFGLSTFNNSLGTAPPGNEGSTIAGAGPGSVGWQAPEVMAQRLSPESASMDTSSGPESFMEASPVDVTLSGRTSRSVDIFSLGCIFYCTLLPGSHPFGEWYEREANIMKNRPAVDALKKLSFEAWDLVRAMINRNPKARPSAAQVCNHPFFWDASRRLAFICDFSDRLESDFESNSAEYDFERLLVERQAADVVGISWASKIDSCLFNNIQKFRTYDTSSVRDCLRLIRNKHHHFDELPAEFKETVPTQKALLEYFQARFPKLLMHCYLICRDILKTGDQLSMKYNIPCQSTNLHTHGGRNTCTRINEADGVKEVVRVSSSTPPLAAVIDVQQRENNLVSSLGNESELSDMHKSLNQIETSPEIVNSCPLTSTETKDYSFAEDLIIWQGSTAALKLNCRGWMRSEEEWIRRTNEKIKKRNPHLVKCAEDGKYRTRLCNHWDTSQGTYCPMLKKNKCVFAHGPAELRVKEGKRNRWGKLVDANGNNSNPRHSGGEDTYGAACQIENSRKVEGKWTVDNTGGAPKKKGRGKKYANTSYTNTSSRSG